MRLHSLILKLQEIETTYGDRPVVLVVEANVLPIEQVWWEAGQRHFENGRVGAVCIGDDPR